MVQRSDLAYRKTATWSFDLGAGHWEKPFSVHQIVEDMQAFHRQQQRLSEHSSFGGEHGSIASFERDLLQAAMLDYEHDQRDIRGRAIQRYCKRMRDIGLSRLQDLLVAVMRQGDGTKRRGVNLARLYIKLTATGIAYVRQQLAKRLGEMSRTVNTELEERASRLARTEEKIHGLIGFISEGDRSNYVVSALKDLEAHAEEEKRAIEQLRSQATEPIPLPSIDEMTQAVFEIQARLDADPIAGRESLHRLFQDRRITCEPQDDGVYLAKSELLPMALLTEKGIGGPRNEDRRYIAVVAGTRFELATFGL